jgi:predicted DNA-binding transcriptional regulator YafY
MRTQDVRSLGENHEMADTATRAFELIDRLEGATPRTATELARQLGVTERTIRRDIARLRDLGYPVDTIRGGEGGYRLEPGAVLPPLVLTPGQAVAIAVALAHRPDGVEGTDVIAALAKLRAVLPKRLALTVDAMLSVSRRIVVDDALRPAAFPVDTTVLAQLALACTRRSRLQFDYSSRARRGMRTADPLALVAAAGRWYLVAFDVDVRQWRTLRVDRIADLVTTDTPAGEHGAPADDLDVWVTEQLAHGWQQVRAVVRVRASTETVKPFIAAGWGTVEAEPDGTCLLRVGADSYGSLARWLLLLDAELTVLEPDELREEFASLAARASAASAG